MSLFYRRHGVGTLRFLVVSFAISLSAIPCTARIIMVNANGTGEYPTIQAAIDGANAGDIIELQRGRYTGNGNRDIDFKGKAITLRSTTPNDWNMVEATIIDSNGTESNHHRAFYFHHYEDANSVIDGLTITNGCQWAGGGIQCEHSSPTIKNCIIRDNRSVSDVGEIIVLGEGGGIYSYESKSSINNCRFINNTTTGMGGAIYACVYHSTGILTVSNCLFKNNSAGGGGAIRCWKGNTELRNCVINNNSSKYGGGVSCNEATITISNCAISYNNADAGGGLLLSTTAATLTNNILWFNTAPAGPQITLSTPTSPTTLKVSYSDIEGGAAAISIGPGCILNWLSGNINVDPAFVDPNNGDYHLKSLAGRWDPNLYLGADINYDGTTNLLDYAILAGSWMQFGVGIKGDLSKNNFVDYLDLMIFVDSYLTLGEPGGWVHDNIASRCIDAGNPGCPLGSEKSPNGNRINMGAYGGTYQASKSPANWALLADLTNDGVVDFRDYAYLASYWLISDVEQPGDLNRNGTVNFADLELFTKDWLDQTIWYH